MKSRFWALVFISLLEIAGLFCACGPATTTTLPASSLADTSWVLISYSPSASQTTVPVHRTITLNFRGLGGYDGSTGINNYGGALRFEGNQLTIRGLTQTPDVDPVGNAYLALLRQAETVEYQGERLIIQCRNGQALVFRPA